MRPVDPVVRRRRGEQMALVDVAGTWVRHLGRRLPLERAVVFGSVARGDFNRWSDVDLLLVSPAFRGSPLRRLEQLGDRPARVQPVCWTPAEWRAERDRGAGLLVRVVASENEGGPRRGRPLCSERQRGVRGRSPPRRAASRGSPS
jgi:uncharacterized protein